MICLSFDDFLAIIIVIGIYELVKWFVMEAHSKYEGRKSRKSKSR